MKELKCVEGASQCTLVGTDLFLLQQAGTDAQLAVTVPEGFGDTNLNITRPNGTLYLKLRDDPSVVNTAVLPVTPEPKAQGQRLLSLTGRFTEHRLGRYPIDAPGAALMIRHDLSESVLKHFAAFLEVC